MAHIKEPKGIDFIIESKPLTDDDRAATSQYIRNYKAKQKAKQNIPRETTKVTRKTSASTSSLSGDSTST